MCELSRWGEPVRMPRCLTVKACFRGPQWVGLNSSGRDFSVFKRFGFSCIRNGACAPPVNFQRKNNPSAQQPVAVMTHLLIGFGGRVSSGSVSHTVYKGDKDCWVSWKLCRSIPVPVILGFTCRSYRGMRRKRPNCVLEQKVKMYYLLSL